jgi:hypothetical protein
MMNPTVIGGLVLRRGHPWRPTNGRQEPAIELCGYAGFPGLRQ